MNWRNVVRLIRVDSKSGRLVYGNRFRRFRESNLFDYLLYGGAILLGTAIGLGAGFLYVSAEESFQHLFQDGIHLLFPSLPSLVLLYSVIFTMMRQIQRTNVKASIQLPYWLPITWEEHTLASTMTHLIGFPAASMIAMALAVVILSSFMGELLTGLLIVPALLASAFLASATTEIFRVVQVRVTGAVYKSSGKTAIWVRFLGSLLFIVAFYVVWFSITSGAGTITFVQIISGAQQTVWFVPYVWPGILLVVFMDGQIVQTLAYSLGSLVFVVALFYVAVQLNKRFGLYEPPAITVSRGPYVPRPGFLGRLGLPSLEAAIIRKDFRALTRRREIMYLFILPLISVLMPLMQFAGMVGEAPPFEVTSFLSGWVILAPGAIMAIALGLTTIGQEGQSISLLYSSPISSHSLVKAKYLSVTLISLLTTGVAGVAGILAGHPSLTLGVAVSIEAMVLILALGAVSLEAGIRGADFRETPRPRMVRRLPAFLNVILCLLLASVILTPLLPHAIAVVDIPFLSVLPELPLYASIAMSVAVGLVIAVVFYRLALRSAERFLAKSKI